MRAGASPRQKGTVGGAPFASSTSMRDDLPSTRRMRQEVFPSSMMSPAMLSTAKSSSTVPTEPPSGSATTVNSALSGNRAAARDRRQPRSAPRPQLAIDAVMMQISAVASPLRRDPLRKHLQHSCRKSRAKDCDTDKLA